MGAHAAAGLAVLAEDGAVAILGVIPAHGHEPVSAILAPAGQIPCGNPPRQVQVEKGNQVVKSGALRHLRLPGFLVPVRDKGVSQTKGY